MQKVIRLKHWGAGAMLSGETLYDHYQDFVTHILYAISNSLEPHFRLGLINNKLIQSYVNSTKLVQYKIQFECGGLLNVYI